MFVNKQAKDDKFPPFNAVSRGDGDSQGGLGRDNDAMNLLLNSIQVFLAFFF